MLTNTTTVNRYLINGTPLATYSISFPYWDKDEIKVYLTESDGTLQTLVENTNYTLSTPNGNNGTLTRVGDWTAGATNLTIAREMSLTQEVDLRNGDKIDAETLETALDNLTAQVQQLAETQERSVTSPIDEAGASLVLPSSSERAGSGSGTIMGFGSGGNSVVLRDLAQFDADVQSASDDAAAARGYATASFNSKELSKEWATSNSIVESTDYSAKKYAEDSKDYAAVVSAHATQIDDIADDLTNLDTVAAAITDVSAVAGKITEVAAVADDLTNIDAVASNKTNIDAVAAVDSDVTTVAGIASDVTTVAGATSDIAAILPDVADVSAVAGDLTKVTAVADDLTNIDNVADDLTNIDNVSSFKTSINTVASDITAVAHVATNMTSVLSVDSNSANINNVAGNISAVSTVASIHGQVINVSANMGRVIILAAIRDEIVDVAGIKSDVSAVGGAISDVSAVAAGLTDIGTVATDISDVSTVAADIANVSVVAGDLTNIDAVAADLANIDAADDYALEAEGWANGTQNGTPVTSGSPYYENNAKYWADAVPALQAQVNANSARITNLEQTTKQDEQTVQYPDDGNYSSIMPNGIPASVADYASWDRSRGKTRSMGQMINTNVTQSGIIADVSYSISNGVMTLNGTANARYDLVFDGFSGVSIPSGHAMLLMANLPVGDYEYAFMNSGGAVYADRVINTSEICVLTQDCEKIYAALIIHSGDVFNDTKIVLPQIWDLNVTFPEYSSAQLTALGVSGVLELVPGLGEFMGHTAGDPVYDLVNTTVTGVEARDSSDNVIASLMLSQPVELKSAGAVAEVLDVQTGKKTRPIDSIDLSTLVYVYNASGDYGYWTSTTAPQDIKVPITTATVPTNITHPIYSPQSYASINGSADNIGRIAVTDTGAILVNNGSSTTPPTGILNYELNTPLSDEQVCDPIPDNFVKVQANGTINTIQSQSPVIDNCLDVTYDIIPA